MSSPSVRIVVYIIARGWMRTHFAPGQCRPLSKTVRFNVLRVSKNKAAAKSFGKF